MNENEEQRARDRIEEARSDAAAYLVQRSPLDQVDASADEQKILDVVEEARDEDDSGKLNALADEAEQAAAEVRREAYGEDREHA
jgi:hypothetical protein